MQTMYVVAGVVAIVVIAGILVSYPELFSSAIISGQYVAPAQTASESQQETAAESAEGAATQESLGVSESVAVETTAAQEHTITITNAGFSPDDITISKGDTVTFVNEGSSDSWPASALHPTHSVYPTAGGCIGSTFDACRGLKTGESWSFTFDEAGEWKYHDHLRTSNFGSITVQ